MKLHYGEMSAGDLATFMDCLDRKYTCAGFNDEAKFGFHRVAVMKIAPLEALAMYRGVWTYNELQQAVKDFESGTRAFGSSTEDLPKSNSELLEEEQAKIVKLLVCPDARVQNVEMEINKLTDQLANMMLLMKKGQSGTGRAGGDRSGHSIGYGFGKGCSYCRKPGHGASRRLENPNRDKICNSCGNMRHRPETCWSTKKQPDMAKKARQNCITIMQKEGDSPSFDEDS